MASKQISKLDPWHPCIDQFVNRTECIFNVLQRPGANVITRKVARQPRWIHLLECAPAR